MNSRCFINLYGNIALIEAVITLKYFCHPTKLMKKSPENMNKTMTTAESHGYRVLASWKADTRNTQKPKSVMAPT